MSSETPTPPFSTLIRVLSIIAGTCMSVGMVSTLLMLALKWATAGAPQILSILPLLLIPLAFISLLAALFFSVLSRRSL